MIGKNIQHLHWTNSNTSEKPQWITRREIYLLATDATTVFGQRHPLYFLYYIFPDRVSNQIYFYVLFALTNNNDHNLHYVAILWYYWFSTFYSFHQRIRINLRWNSFLNLVLWFHIDWMFICTVKKKRKEKNM